jgi:hypothetical protein
MIAKEMFEKLGYDLVNDNKYITEYWNLDGQAVVFYKKTKSYLSYKSTIDMELFKAIQQQIKELDWE